MSSEGSLFSGKSGRWIIFLFFFVSGFCSLAYQVIWTRLAFASFGIVTPVLSVVISVFMLGLSVGSWAGGKLAVPLSRKTGLSAAIFYGAAECLIGVGAYVVPHLFAVGEHVLLSAGGGDSFRYLFLSALVLAICILPWCIFMGATFPFMMAYLQETRSNETDGFSYLYVANVLGAMTGTFLTAIVLIEVFGFHSTLHLGAGANFIIALCSLLLGARKKKGSQLPMANEPQLLRESSGRSSLVKWILFSTGFCAMAMEVVWTRQFTPILKTQVYSFALIVFVYLGATLAGSLWYRRHLKSGKAWQTAALMAALVIAALLPIPASDPRFVHMDMLFSIRVSSAFMVLASIFPLCAILGYLTPGLIDKFCQGNPAAAGRAYAINVVGCILGPLIASYVLLPWMSERSALLVLTLPLVAFYFLLWKTLPLPQRVWSGGCATLLAVYGLFFSQSFAESFVASSSRVEVRRDYAASVISADPQETKRLLVNGIGMTTLTPITKFMIHLPMTFHKGTPQSALVICFGMGTSYRSALSWDVKTTAVELIPSVPKAFAYYHDNAVEILKDAHGQIVIDDGRRYLKRTQTRYDIIATDPPPPLEAAGSSLLYSTEFYDLVKQHLNPQGIIAVWLPFGDEMIDMAAVRSVYGSFPYVRCFPSVEPGGVHLLASLEPIEQLTVEQLAGRMPEKARKDLLEWKGGQDAATYLKEAISREIPVEMLLNSNADIRITDDDPFNEYYLLRRKGLF